MKTQIHKSDEWVIIETATKTRTAQTVIDSSLKNYSGSVLKRVKLNLVTDKQVETRLSIMGCLRGPVDFTKLIMESLKEGPKAEKLWSGWI